MSCLPGPLPNTYEKEKPKARFTGGTIFVDGKTGFIHHHHQVSLRVGEKLKAIMRLRKAPQNSGFIFGHSRQITNLSPRLSSRIMSQIKGKRSPFPVLALITKMELLSVRSK
jgi:hypothetical protein